MNALVTLVTEGNAAFARSYGNGPYTGLKDPLGG